MSEVITLKQSDMISMLIEGHNIKDIADKLNVSRQTIYTWMEKDHIKAELDRRRKDLARQGNAMILKDLTSYINTLKELAKDKTDKRVCADINKYLLNRILGSPTSIVDDENSNNDENVDKNELEMELEAFKGKLKRVK